MHYGTERETTGKAKEHPDVFHVCLIDKYQIFEDLI